ncbi:coiled-coil domain-containing protein 97 isoform X1 [Chiloscyllium plagiosum]|uniref:coiled-coil domain-containing protein 97 isoform X1 n=2 Tax=Chiloscyllium plagiosum TaxID=36176 RepID=UPI001CB874F8|nr:coiled-coil domain-containing protein 97 isoform X1 [Chiloscyllium plagiosum]
MDREDFSKRMEGSQTQDLLQDVPKVSDPSADIVTQEASAQVEGMSIISTEDHVSPSEVEEQIKSSVPTSPQEIDDAARLMNKFHDEQQEDAMNASLNSMFHTIASSKAQIKSQQKDEPDLMYDQKLDIIKDLFWCKPVVFLERFHKIIKEEHLVCFNHLAENYEVTFYSNEIRKSSMKKTARTNVRNKRYAALQQLIKDGEYFSDEQMRTRDPLLYQQYIRQYMTEEELLAENSKNLSNAMCLSDLLMSTYQEKIVQERLQWQQEREDACVEEEEDDEEEDDDTESKAADWIPSDDERSMLREEFVSRMYQRFLDGEDSDFDYSAVDDNPDFDNLDIINRDEEERYFDEEEPVEVEDIEMDKD